MIFGEVEAFASLIERFFKINKKEHISEPEKEDLISTRFMNICSAHGVHRNQIPRVFDSDLTLHDVQSDQHLLKKLDEKMIVQACELFGINRDWLDGVNGQIYPTYDFYAGSSCFKEFLADLMKKSSGKIDGVLLSPKESNKRYSALLLLQETVGHISDSPIYRYYLCNNWSFSYWKARGLLASCVAQCWKHKIYIIGKSTSYKFIDSIEAGESILDLKSSGVYSIDGARWYAEDMASLPEVFLDGIDPEIDNFGYKAGLKLWLELESSGLMDSGMQDSKARERFITELQKYD